MAGEKGDSCHKINPHTLWAQRRDKLYITIDLEDVKEERIDLDEKSLHFSCKGGLESKEYEVNLSFFNEIKPEESKQRVTGRLVYFSIQKKEDAYWPKLLCDTKKPHWLKVDFEKWRDEDDSDVEEDNKDMQFEDMMSQMGNFNTGGGAVPEEPDSDDSDDGEMPDLTE